MNLLLEAFDDDRLLSLYEAHRPDLQALKRRPWVSSGTPRAQILCLLLRHTRPDVVIEVSPGRGWTSYYMLRALLDNGRGQVYSYDLDEASESLACSRLNSRRADASSLCAPGKQTPR